MACRARFHPHPTGSMPVPSRPLKGGTPAVWEQGNVNVRIYHRDVHRPSATAMRAVGPLESARFDPHEPGPDPMLYKGDRRVLYLAEMLATAVCEVFFERAGPTSPMAPPVVTICRSWYAAYVEPTTSVTLQDFVDDSPVTLGAPDDLGDGPWARSDTHGWARAIHEDTPADTDVAGIRYWSACHRETAGQRSGINVVVWERAAPLIVRSFSASDPNGEIALHEYSFRAHLEEYLGDDGVGVEWVDQCDDCAVGGPA